MGRAGGDATDDKATDGEMVIYAKDLLSRNLLLEDIRAWRPNPDTLAGLSEAWDRAAARLERVALSPSDDTNDYECLVSLAADYLRDHKIMPWWLSDFAADVLEGKRKRPTKRGPDKYKNWARDYKFWRVTDEVAKTYRLPLYSNSSESKKPASNDPKRRRSTAAEIVSRAYGAGIDVHAVRDAYREFAAIARGKTMPELAATGRK